MARSTTREVEPPTAGKVIALLRLGGLHHEIDHVGLLA
jgi:hypothetical protein